MQKTYIVIVTLLFINFIFGQNINNKSELCVINMLGAKVYEKPTFESKTLTALSIGECIIVEKSLDTYDKLNIGNRFSLSGNWIKPEKIKGFIFSADLTSKKVKIVKSKQGQIFIDLLGELTNKKEDEKLIKTENGEFPKYFEYRYYENGTYSYTAWDGCFNYATEYQNLNLNEVYHQMVSDHGGIMYGKDFWVPIFQEKIGDVIKFEGEGATQDLKIEIKENGIIVVSSYDCT